MNKNQVYLDNAATTALDPQVGKTIVEFLYEFGNPSSTHSQGRAAKAIVEKSRKTIAELFGVAAGEIVFTSGGTEADNFVIKGSVESLGIGKVISSPLEHHAVLHSIEALPKNIEKQWLTPDNKGRLSLEELESLLQKRTQPTLVSLMHGNNEIGNLIDIDQVGKLCRQYGAYFHSDTVQTIGHYPINCRELHFLAASAHKFHGPKGVGFALVKKGAKILPFMHGGGQERGMRGGTENVVFIAAMAKALEISLTNAAAHRLHIESLKTNMITGLKALFGESVYFNGLSDTQDSLYTVLNVSLPPTESKDLFLFHLDMRGVAASGGSACSSGALAGSHVLRAIGADQNKNNVRFSFSRFNTEKDIDFTLNILAELYESDTKSALATIRK